MTGHQINSLVGDLVAMAQAMEQLPQVESDLRNANSAYNSLMIEKEGILADLEQAKSYAASLEAKVHSAEVARDDAELRFLEADEQRTHTLDRLNQMGNIIRAVTNELDPPKPQPEPQPEPMVETGPVTEAEVGSAPSLETVQRADHVQTAQGQSEPHPTAHGASVTPVSETTGASTTENVSSLIEPSPSGPYSGHRYTDYPGYVNRMDWLAGGGTEEDYDFRY